MMTNFYHHFYIIIYLNIKTWSLLKNVKNKFFWKHLKKNLIPKLFQIYKKIKTNEMKNFSKPRFKAFQKMRFKFYYYKRKAKFKKKIYRRILYFKIYVLCLENIKKNYLYLSII